MSVFNRKLFDSLPIIGIMRHFPEQHLQPVVSTFLDAGFTTLEITMNSTGATESIRNLREQWGDKMNIGAGTVLSRKELDAALEAGAQFIVTPILNRAVVRACVKEDIPVFPGAMTPTEIYKAWKWGATMVKVFPAARLGPGYIKDVLDPLNKLQLIPTGGIHADNFIEYLKMGASGVGIASALFPKDLIEQQNWAELRTFYDSIVRKYRQFKQENN